MAMGTSSCGAMLLYCQHNVCAASDLMNVHPSALCHQKGAVTTHPQAFVHLFYCLHPQYGHDCECKVEMLVDSPELC